MFLALSGGMLGAFLAAWGVSGLLRFLPSNLPRAAEIQIDARMFWLTFGISLVSGLLFGFLPALEASSTNLNLALRSDGRGATGGSGRSRLRRSMVVAEVALSLMLLSGAGLLMKSFVHLRSLSPGFDSEKVLAVRLSLPSKRYSTRDAIATLHEKLHSGFEKLPGVETAGATSILPLSGATASVTFQIAGRPAASRKDVPDVQYRMIDWNFLRAMRIPIRRGRDLSELDTAQTQVVALISESTARKYFAGQDPVGLHIHMEDNQNAGRDAEIVGVAGDVRLEDLESDPPPCLYVSMRQIPDVNSRWIANNMFWVIRTASSPASLDAVARRVVRSADGDVAASSVQPLDQYLSTAVASRRFSLFLLGTFTGAALLLAASGLYSLISHFVMQRRREIGVRVALGAQPRDIFLQVVGEGVSLTIGGVLIGLVATFFVTRLISKMLFGVSSHDPTTIAEVVVVLVVTGVAASYFPARRAVRIDPMVALREE